jgi:hypothetical protein
LEKKFTTCACGERSLLVDGGSCHCFITLEVSVEPAADADVEEAIYENLIVISDIVNTLLTDDIFP